MTFRKLRSRYFFSIILLFCFLPLLQNCSKNSPTENTTNTQPEKNDEEKIEKKVKKMTGIQIETYRYATTSSGGQLSEEDRAQGHYGGARQLHKLTTRTVHKLDKAQAEDFLASKLTFSSAFRTRKKELSVKDYITNNTKTESYDLQMKEFLSTPPDDRHYRFSDWLDPRNMSSLSIVIVRLDGIVVYVDNLFYGSEYLSKFSYSNPSKKEDIGEIELVDFVLENDEIVSFFPKIKNETILKIKHFSDQKIRSTFEVKGFGKFSFKEKSSSYKIGQTKYAVIESLLEHMEKYDFKNIDPKFRMVEKPNRYTYGDEHVEFSVLQNGKLETFSFDGSNQIYSKDIVNLEKFALELFKNIPR